MSPGFGIPPGQACQLQLDVEAISDNDIWVNTTNQALIFNSSNGSSIEMHWHLKPADCGTASWTVVEQFPGPGSGPPQQYLARHSGVLANIIASATSGSGS